MDQFELVVEHAAADQHVHLTGFYPVQEFHHQIRDILRQSAKMQDMPLTVHHTHRPGAEHAGLLHQASGHDAMSSQQIVYRIGIEFLQPLINLVGILDLCNILWRSQNLLPFRTAVTCSKERVFCSMAKEPWMVRMRFVRRRVGFVDSCLEEANRPTNSAISTTELIIVFVISKGGFLFLIFHLLSKLFYGILP